MFSHAMEYVAPFGKRQLPKRGENSQLREIRFDFAIDLDDSTDPVRRGVRRDNDPWTSAQVSINMQRALQVANLQSQESQYPVYRNRHLF